MTAITKKALSKLESKVCCLMKDVQLDSDNELSLILSSKNARIGESDVALLLDISISSNHLYRYTAHMIAEPIEAFPSIKAVQDKITQVQKLQEHLTTGIASDVVIRPILLTQEISTIALERIRCSGISYVNLSNGEISIRLPYAFFFKAVTRELDPEISLENMMLNRKCKKSPKAVIALKKLKESCRAWSIKELAEESEMSTAGVYRIKQNLLTLGLVGPDNTGHGKAKFRLTEEGIKELDALNFQ